MVGEPKIINSIVKAVPVLVVDDLAFAGVEDLAVHIDGEVAGAFGSQSHRNVSRAVFYCEPRVFGQLVESTRVNAAV